MLKLIEEELSKEDEQISNRTNTSSIDELEPVLDAPNNLSIYPPILVLEKQKHLESILISDHKVTGYK